MTSTPTHPVETAPVEARAAAPAGGRRPVRPQPPLTVVTAVTVEAVTVPGARWAVRVVVACADCATSCGPYPSWAQARLMAGRHDLVQHRGRATAQLSDARLCESCRRAPATATWTHPPAGAPFSLCAGCHPEPDHTGSTESADGGAASVRRQWRPGRSRRPGTGPGRASRRHAARPAHLGWRVR